MEVGEGKEGRGWGWGGHLFQFEWEWDGGRVGVGAYSRPGTYQRFLPLGWALI